MKKFLMLMMLPLMLIGGGKIEIEDYEKPLTVGDEGWEAVRPYLFLEDKSVKTTLDKLFGNARVTADREALLEHGFTLTPTQGLHVIVAGHPKLSGYLLKIIVDKYDINHEGLGEDWEQWIRRIEGERLIREGIKKLGYRDIFKVPHQWVYPLPNGPRPYDEPGYDPRSFILIVEDMKLATKEKNSKHFKRLEKWELEAIYEIATQYGLADCCNRNNLPLCKDGKMAFVDTEIYNQWPVDYHQMLQYLSDRGREYWKKITK